MKLLNLFSPALAAAMSCAAIACTEPAEPPPDPAAAAEVGPAEALPRALPAPGAAPRYVGLWASAAESCTHPAWAFQERSVDTVGEVNCSFYNVSMTDSGYDIEAMCRAQAPPAPYRIQVSFAESARAMMLSGGPWAPTSLVYCGPAPSP